MFCVLSIYAHFELSILIFIESRIEYFVFQFNTEHKRAVPVKNSSNKSSNQLKLYFISLKIIIGCRFLLFFCLKLIEITSIALIFKNVCVELRIKYKVIIKLNTQNKTKVSSDVMFNENKAKDLLLYILIYF